MMRITRMLFVSALLCACSSAPSSLSVDLEPPTAPTWQTSGGFGKGSDSEIQRYLSAELSYTERTSAPLATLVRTLKNEYLDRELRSPPSPPLEIGAARFETKRIPGVPIPFVARVDGMLPQTVLDPLTLAALYPGRTVSSLRLSPELTRTAVVLTGPTYDRRLITTDIGGEAAPIESRVFNPALVEWFADNDHLLIGTGAGIETDAVVLARRENDSGTAVIKRRRGETILLSRTKSGRFLTVRVFDGSRTAVHLFDSGLADRAAHRFEIAHRSRPAVIEERQGKLYVLSDGVAPRGELRVGSIEDFQQRNAAVFPHPLPPNAVLYDFELFNEFLVLYARVDAVDQIAVYRFDTGTWRQLPIEGAVRTLSAAGTPDVGSRRFRFWSESLLEPRSLWSVDAASGERTPDWTESVENFAPKQYEERLILLPCGAALPVPVRLAYRTDRGASSSRPLLIGGYGAYGHPASTAFSVERLSLLDRGFIAAVVEARGGGAYGADWHDGGRLMHKPQSFADLRCAAEALPARGWGASGKVVAYGKSAGGLLALGAALDNPSLFTGIVLDMPFTDVAGAMQDETLPLSAREYHEWGDPRVAGIAELQRAYSPSTRTLPPGLPPILITLALDDEVVSFRDPLSWAARVRAERPVMRGPLLIQSAGPGGHAGPAGSGDTRDFEAFKGAFALTAANSSQ